MGPEQLQHWWELGNAAQVLGTERPTQAHGRNLDWQVGCVILPLDARGTIVVPGADHAGVTPRAGTLRHRLVGPASIPDAALMQFGHDGWAQCNK